MDEQNKPVESKQPSPAPVVRVRNSSKHFKLKKRRGKSKKFKLRIPKTREGQFAFFFVIEFFSCLVLVAATRAEAQGNLFWTTVTSFLWELQVFITWLMMYEDKNARTWFSGAGMILGSTIGADAALLLTKYLYGK